MMRKACLSLVVLLLVACGGSEETLILEPASVKSGSADLRFNLPPGSSFTVGSQFVIQWGLVTCLCENTDWFAERVHIDLYKGSYPVMRIASGLPGYSADGYTWTIPNLPQYGGDFRLRISDTGNSGTFSYSEPFAITGGPPLTQLAQVVMNDSYPQLGETVTITSTSQANITYSVSIKYTLNGQSQSQPVHTHSGANPLGTLTTSVPLWTLPGLAYTNMVLQVSHNGMVVQEYTRTLFPAVVNVVLNDSTPQLGETVSITSTPGAQISYSVRIKYTQYGQVQYQQVHSHTGPEPKTTSVTLWNSPGLANTNMVLQVYGSNGVVMSEYNRTLLP